ncbi:MAG: hypothetical protein E6R03_03045 [Hyphomicrobiaceae bacterium]|nr:MAG: hypothetical protein E6R03_03045 [Hyphomicrobiaceae bacterium]
MHPLVQYFSNVPAPVFRGRLLAFEKAFAQTQELVSREFFPTFHMFGDGTYVRYFYMPKGSAAFGKIHKHEHIGMFMHGKMLSITEHGVDILEGLQTFVVPPGTKRFVYAYEDSLYATVHKTNSRDLEEIEKDIMTNDYESVGLDVIEQEALV